MWSLFNSKRIHGFSCFPKHFTVRPEFHRLWFWMLCATFSSRKVGKSNVFEEIFEVTAAVNFTGFCSEILSNITSIYRDFGGWQMTMQIPVAARSKAWVLSAGILGSNPSGTWMTLRCECCVLLSRSVCVGLITRPEGTTQCSVSECDREFSIMRRLLPLGAVASWKLEWL
jgi:hypothetical protein